jgi:23S rRNA pseudoU1915 N3-methylase RlmH
MAVSIKRSNVPKSNFDDLYMDEFPIKFNREYLTAKLKKNQEIMIEETRKIFSDKIDSTLNDYRKQITLKFDPKIWKSSRLKIVEELLQIHGNLQLIMLSGQSIEVNISTDLPKGEIVNTIIIRI